MVSHTKRYIAVFSLLVLSLSTTWSSVHADVDQDSLMDILWQLTADTGTGTTTTTTPLPSTAPDHLVIMLPLGGKAGESMDMTVKALAKDGSVATSYRGTIFISVENDYKATVPYVDGYSFTSLDQWVKTFSKGLSFSKAGTFKVSVSDFAQSKFTGSSTITISAGTPVTTVKPTPVKPVVTVPEKTTPVKTEVKPVVEVKPATANTPPKTTTTSSPPSFKIGKIEIGDKKATITFQVLNDTADIEKFEFLYADPEGKSKKVTTSNKSQIKQSNGNYVWYIADLDLTKYVVSVAWINKNGETVSASQPFEMNLSLLAAGKCIIPNVSGLRVLEKKDSSILYWDSIPEAILYKVYKKDANGEYIFLTETKQDSYTVHVSDGSVKYEEFSVKAVCSDGTESLKFSPSTSVKTGPGAIALLVIVSGSIGWYIVRRKRLL